MALSTFTFSGAYEANHAPAEGRIAVIPNRPVLDPDNDTVIVGKFVSQLDAEGGFSLSLPTEADLFYTLIADLVGAANYQVTFAAGSPGSTLTVDQVTPVEPSVIPAMNVSAILAYIDDVVEGSVAGVTSVAGRGGVVTLTLDDVAETSTKKILSAAERTKLAGIATSATANAADAALRDRSTHTGTQLAVTVSDFVEAVEDAVAALIGRSTHTGISWSYSDAGTGVGTLAATVSGGGGTVDEEGVRDVIAAALQGQGVITVTNNDAFDTITISTTATVNSPDSALLARANHTGTQSADTLTDGSTNKAFLATERTKLTGIATSATANSSDATLLSRANHTGTQISTTISDFVEAVEDAVAALLARSTHSGITFTYTDSSNTLAASVAGGASAVYVWRYTGGAYPSIPSSAPAGVQVVQVFGPEQPASVPSWIGVTPDKIPAVYTYVPLT